MPSLRRTLFDFDLQGVEELDKAFRSLPDAVGKSVLIGALREAAVPVRDDAKSFAPHDDGDLIDSIQISTRLTNSQKPAFRAGRFSGTVFVGPSHPKGSHGVLVEFGTGPRYNKAGKYLGVMPPQPFMRTAWDQNQDRILKILREIIWSKLKGAARSLAKRAKKGTLSRSVRRSLGG